MKFEEISTKIYPWIKVKFDLDDNQGTSESLDLDFANSPVLRPWLGDLIVMYAVDQGDRFDILQNRQVPAEITLADIERIALENLARDVQFRFVETGFGGHGLLAGGDHETGALCWPGIWEWCAAQINDDLVVAAPAKDLLMMVPASDLGKIGALIQFVEDFFVNGTRLLTKQLYHFDRSSLQWTIYQLHPQL